MNPLPELDEEYPVDLTLNYTCQTCEDIGGFWHKGHFKPCPACRERKEESDDQGRD